MTADTQPIKAFYSSAREDEALCHHDYGDFRRGPPQP